jgi:hypothetical protein
MVGAIKNARGTNQEVTRTRRDKERQRSVSRLRNSLGQPGTIRSESRFFRAWTRAVRVDLSLSLDWKPVRLPRARQARQALFRL